MQMPLKEKDMTAVAEYVQAHLAEWMRKFQPQEWYPPTALLERMVRVEEELKYLRETTIMGFRKSDERFDVPTKQMDRFMVWTFGLAATVCGIIIAVFR